MKSDHTISAILECQQDLKALLWDCLYAENMEIPVEFQITKEDFCKNSLDDIKKTTDAYLKKIDNFFSDSEAIKKIVPAISTHLNRYANTEKTSLGRHYTITFNQECYWLEKDIQSQIKIIAANMENPVAARCMAEKAKILKFLITACDRSDQAEIIKSMVPELNEESEPRRLLCFLKRDFKEIALIFSMIELGLSVYGIDFTSFVESDKDTIIKIDGEEIFEEAYEQDKRFIESISNLENLEKSAEVNNVTEEISQALVQDFTIEHILAIHDARKKSAEEINNTPIPVTEVKELTVETKKRKKNTSPSSLVASISASQSDPSHGHVTEKIYEAKKYLLAGLRKAYAALQENDQEILKDIHGEINELQLMNGKTLKQMIELVNHDFFSRIHDKDVFLKNLIEGEKSPFHKKIFRYQLALESELDKLLDKETPPAGIDLAQPVTQLAAYVKRHQDYFVLLEDIVAKLKCGVESHFEDYLNKYIDIERNFMPAKGQLLTLPGVDFGIINTALAIVNQKLLEGERRLETFNGHLENKNGINAINAYFSLCRQHEQLRKDLALDLIPENHHKGLLELIHDTDENNLQSLVDGLQTQKNNVANYKKLLVERNKLKLFNLFHREVDKNIIELYITTKELVATANNAASVASLKNEIVELKEDIYKLDEYELLLIERDDLLISLGEYEDRCLDREQLYQQLKANPQSLEIIKGEIDRLNEKLQKNHDRIEFELLQSALLPEKNDHALCYLLSLDDKQDLSSADHANSTPKPIPHHGAENSLMDTMSYDEFEQTKASEFLIHCDLSPDPLTESIPDVPQVTQLLYLSRMKQQIQNLSFQEYRANKENYSGLLALCKTVISRDQQDDLWQLYQNQLDLLDETSKLKSKAILSESLVNKYISRFPDKNHDYGILMAEHKKWIDKLNRLEAAANQNLLISPVADSKPYLDHYLKSSSNKIKTCKHKAKKIEHWLNYELPCKAETIALDLHCSFFTAEKIKISKSYAIDKSVERELRTREQSFAAVCQLYESKLQDFKEAREELLKESPALNSEENSIETSCILEYQNVLDLKKLCESLAIQCEQRQQALNVIVEQIKAIHQKRDAASQCAHILLEQIEHMTDELQLLLDSCPLNDANNIHDKLWMSVDRLRKSHATILDFMHDKKHKLLKTIERLDNVEVSLTEDEIASSILFAKSCHEMVEHDFAKVDKHAFQAAVDSANHELDLLINKRRSCAGVCGSFLEEINRYILAMENAFIDHPFTNSMYANSEDVVCKRAYDQDKKFHDCLASAKLIATKVQHVFTQLYNPAHVLDEDQIHEHYQAASSNFAVFKQKQKEFDLAVYTHTGNYSNQYAAALKVARDQFCKLNNLAFQVSFPKAPILEKPRRWEVVKQGLFDEIRHKYKDVCDDITTLQSSLRSKIDALHKDFYSSNYENNAPDMLVFNCHVQEIMHYFKKKSRKVDTKIDVIKKLEAQLRASTIDHSLPFLYAHIKQEVEVYNAIYENKQLSGGFDFVGYLYTDEIRHEENHEYILRIHKEADAQLLAGIRNEARREKLEKIVELADPLQRANAYHSIFELRDLQDDQPAASKADTGPVKIEHEHADQSVSQCFDGILEGIADFSIALKKIFDAVVDTFASLFCCKSHVNVGDVPKNTLYGPTSPALYKAYSRPIAVAQKNVSHTPQSFSV